MSAAADPAKAWEMKAFKHDRILTTCKFAPSGDTIFAGGIDGKIHRWAVESGERSDVGSHATWISALLAGPADRLYSADLQGNLKAWDLAAGKPLWSVDLAHPGWLKALALSPDGALLASGGRDRVVRLWSTATGKLVRALQGHGRDVLSAAFHPDGKSLVTGDYDGKILHWDVSTGKQGRVLEAGILTTRNADYLCDVGGVKALAFDAKGERLAASGQKDAKSNTFCPGWPAGLVFAWDSGKSTPFRAKDEKIDGSILALRFLADGTLAGCGDGASAGAIWFWKPGEAEPFHAVSGQSLYEIDLSPDGMSVAAACFEPIGPGGNGNGKPLKKGDYVSNGGKLRLYGLFEKPAKKK